MTKIRAAIIGYGNIGKKVLEALRAAPDFEVAGVVRRSSSLKHTPGELSKTEVVDAIGKLENVDVAILSAPSRQVESIAKQALAMGINTVDSYDIHETIWELRQSLDPLAKENKATSIISAGWDPGSDSLVRGLLQAVAPKGMTYTNFGPGMSMGHTVAVKAVKGVKDALSLTIPTGTGIHRRMVYVELENGYEKDQIAETIKADKYFVNDETHVFEVDNVDQLKDTGHGVNMERKGVSGTTDNQLFDFSMKINNPALTAQILVSCARATTRSAPGAYTMIEIPVADLLEGGREALIRSMV